jgi:hypothetical protein
MIAVCLLPLASMAEESQRHSSDKLVFLPSNNGRFSFDTGRIRGALPGAQLSFGLSNVEHIPTGRTVSGRLGLVNVYRVFSDGKRYGDAGWHWPSRGSRNEDGSVTIEAAAVENRPFGLQVNYRWVNATTLDLILDVIPQRDLKGFEVFLASYFGAAFTESLAYVQARPGVPDRPIFLAAERSLGTWLMFPRDRQAVELIRDGRWKLPPHPVDWEILPQLAQPLAVRRVPESGLTVLLMARPSDCFAISMPYQTEPHFSVYLSLFGRDLASGRRATARVRLQLLDAPSDGAMLEAYRKFRKSAD